MPALLRMIFLSGIAAVVLSGCTPAAGSSPTGGLTPVLGPGPTAVVSPAAGPSSAPPQPANRPAVLVRWAAIGNSSQSYVPVVIAEHGIGAKYGVDVQLVGGNTPDQPWNSLRSGDADVGTGSFLQLLRQRRSGLNVRAVKTFYTTGNSIVAPPDKPYGQLSDLRGVRLGTPSVNLLDWMVLRVAGKKAEGFDVGRDAEVAEAAPPLLNQLLFRDQLDAAFQFRDFTLEPVADGRLREVTSLPKVMAAAGIDVDSNSLLYAVSDNWRARQPNAVPRLVAAIDEAIEVLGKDDAVWPSLAKRSGVENPDLLPAFVEMQRERFKVTYSRAKLEPIQALVAELIATVGPDAVGVGSVDPEAFDFDSAEAAKQLRR